MPKSSTNGENGDVYDSAKEKFQAMHSMTEAGHMVTNLEHVGQQWRGFLIAMLYLHPKAFNDLIDTLLADDAQAANAGNESDMDVRRAAFRKASRHVLTECYEHPLCEGWRVTASRTVKEMDTETFDQYRVVKYAGTNSPDREQRIKAYNIVIARFIEISYTVPGL